MRTLIHFALGLLFGVGLIVASMSDPAKVLSFLHVGGIADGTWDPSLALVMAGGALTTFVGYRLVFQRPAPVMDTQFHLPHRTDIEAPILVGPALFGIGWGLAGLCPGPAFVALGLGIGTGDLTVLPFVLAMLAGMVAARLLALRSPVVQQTVPPSAKRS